VPFFVMAYSRLLVFDVNSPSEMMALSARLFAQSVLAK
jgi:hypothetical protein